MKTDRLLAVFLAIIVAGCASFTSNRSYTRMVYPVMFQALDSEPDGYEGIIRETGEKFKIRSTYASNARLCRLVEITGSGSFVGESFCKAKGGEWR
jgi:hypothetical protein